MRNIEYQSRGLKRKVLYVRLNEETVDAVTKRARLEKKSVAKFIADMLEGAHMATKKKKKPKY